MHSKALLPADDVKIFQPIKGMDDGACLKGDLDVLGKWSVDNRLLFNTDTSSLERQRGARHIYTCMIGDRS